MTAPTLHAELDGAHAAALAAQVDAMSALTSVTLARDQSRSRLGKAAVARLDAIAAAKRAEIHFDAERGTCERAEAATDAAKAALDAAVAALKAADRAVYTARATTTQGDHL